MTIAAAQAGNWSSTSTWVGGVVPGNGDDVTSDYDLTVDVDTTVGSSPSDTTTNALALTTNGKKVTVAAGKTFKVRGNIRVYGGGPGNTGGIYLDAGAVLEFDSSLAGDPTTRYQANMGSGGIGSQAYLRCAGTALAPCVVRSNASGGCCRFTFSFAEWSIDCDHTTFLRVGDTTTTGLSGFTSTVALDHVTFDTCGLTDFAVTLPNLTMTDCSWVNVNAAVDGGSGKVLCCKFSGSDSATGKTVTRCVFEEYVLIGGAFIDYSDCCFNKSFGISFGFSNWSSMDGCMFPEIVFATAGPVTNSYVLGYRAALNHMISITEGYTYEGNVVDYALSVAAAGDASDVFYGTMRTGATTIIRNNLMIPSIADDFATSYVTLGGAFPSGSGDVRILHNTVVGHAPRLAFFNDLACDGNIIVTEIKSNLLVARASDTGASRACAAFDPIPTTDELCVGSGCTHNGFYNPITFTDTTNGSASYDGYEIGCPTTGTPGASDVIADPQLVDDTRSIATWSVYKGYASSGDTTAQKIDAALAAIFADPSLTRADLIPWVRGGFVPTNPVYQAAGHDGVDTGAVEGEWSLTADLDAAQAGDTLSAAAANAVAAAESSTQAGDTGSAAATNAVAAAESSTQAAETLSCAAGAGCVAAGGGTQAGQSCGAAATNAVVANAAPAQAGDTLAASVGGAVADLSATQAANSLSSGASAAVAAAGSNSQAGQSASCAAAGGIAAACSVSQAGNTLSAAATNPNGGTSAPMRVFRITGRAAGTFSVGGASGRVFEVSGAGE